MSSSVPRRAAIKAILEMLPCQWIELRLGADDWIDGRCDTQTSGMKAADSAHGTKHKNVMAERRQHIGSGH